ncbi:ASCH domain-containing protein [Reinekea thalattae]|uniref:ASCH domain-containing protein n=1 Tax=Reinekea thalattae TaxID=2593301 RepID=A0A5C8ZCA1_9GAMM|nr:ASCH domain-containing protein [Reinekea thalattae]
MAPLIIAGRKTGTIRSTAESTFKLGQILCAVTHEEGEFICNLEIKGIEKVNLKNLNRSHAKAEGLPFTFLLKRIARKLYPDESELMFICFKVINQ